MAGAHGVRQADRRGPVTLDEHVIVRTGKAIRAHHHDLWEAVRPLDEVAVSIGRQQRYVEHVRISQVDAEQITGLGLDDCPGGHAARNVVIGKQDAVYTSSPILDQLAGGDRIAGGVELIGTQEHLVRRVRAIGLVLVHERRGGIGVLMDVVGRAENAILPWLVGRTAQYHEVGVAAWHKQRIILFQRDEDGARTAFGDQVQTMIEELPEKGHPGVERRGQSRIRRGVLEQVHIVIIASTELTIQPWAGDYPYAILEYVVIKRTHHAEVEMTIGARVESRGIGRRVVRRLVDDQVTDGARLRVKHSASGLLIRRSRAGRRAGTKEAGRSTFRRIEDRIGHPRKEVIGGAELGVVGAVEVQQVVVRPVDRT
ncbi:hypothetical protein BSF40_50250 [Pseudomonas sp. ACN5]|nr:hypothetical protein BSF40_50250 [Pseudomonas sp. ACN5]